MKTLTRRSFVFSAGATVGAASLLPFTGSVTPRGALLPDDREAGHEILNDASLLNPTPVARHHVLTNADRDGHLALLRRELAAARSEGRPFVVGSARHSMGGQSLARDAVAFTLDQSWIETDREAGTFRVTGGVRWPAVIRHLDAIGFSPKVMQSNNDFGVASTFAVNAHGWPAPHGAFGSTVRAIDLMLADGEIVHCTRDENGDLFRSAIGGYGLTGIILELEVEMVENRRLEPRFDLMSGEELGSRFIAALADDTAIDMAYGRLDVSRDSFLENAMLVTWRPSQDQSALPAATGSGFLSHASRPIFRAQTHFEWAKAMRWGVETGLGAWLGSGPATRNSLLNEPAETLADGDPTRTDILHEYFVAPARFADFVRACREVIPTSYQQLLNITLRFVDTDADSVLNYAPGPRIAAVMLFSQEMSVRAEEDMARMTRELIERVLNMGGSYYLPYRLHARQDQFLRAYPRAREFAHVKRHLDPQLVFRNMLWDRYLHEEAL